MKSKQVFYCSIHKDEIITNYCCLMACQTPLCPECIDEHNKRHKSNNVFPEIDTLNRVTHMCEKKSTMVIDQLQEMIQRLNSLSGVDSENMQRKVKSDLDVMKERLIDQISVFFDNLYNDYVSKMSGSMKKVDIHGEFKILFFLGKDDFLGFFYH